MVRALKLARCGARTAIGLGLAAGIAGKLAAFTIGAAGTAYVIKRRRDRAAGAAPASDAPAA